MKKIGTVLILFMTVGLFAAVIYFSILLSNKSETAATAINKTKASAVTYHKLLALNILPSSAVPTAKPSATVVPTQKAVPTAIQSTPIPTPTMSSSAANSSIPLVFPTVTPTANTPFPSQPPTPTVSLLAYRTITPTLVPIASTGGDGVKVTATPSPIKMISPSAIPEFNNKLPETGWVQISSILFIVAACTVFISFLF